jgi:hypothetical protein
LRASRFASAFFDGFTFCHDPAVPFGIPRNTLFYLFFAEIGGFYFFRYYDVRPNYPLFKHGTDREVLKAIRKGYPVGRIVVMSMLGSGVGMWIAGGTEFFDTLFLLRF